MPATLTRRSLLAGIFAAAAGPAIVRASSLMVLPTPAKLWVEPTIVLLGADYYSDLHKSGEASEYPLTTGELGTCLGFRFVQDTTSYAPQLANKQKRRFTLPRWKKKTFR